MDEKPSKRPRREEPTASSTGGKAKIVHLTNTNNQDSLYLDASHTPVIKLFTNPNDVILRHELHSKQLSLPPYSHLNHSMTMREILGLDPLWKPNDKSSHNPTTKGYSGRKSIEWFVLCNYMCDFQYIMNDFPELLSVPNKVFFVHDGYGAHSEQWRFLDPSADVCNLNPMDDPSKPTNPLRYKFFYGTHHTKMILVGMEDRLRVIVHTANMLKGDVECQANGAFVQDFPLKQHSSVASNPSPLGIDFEKTLKHYLESYDYRTKKAWSPGGPARTLVEQIGQYDFSNAQAILIPSIPGYHGLVPEDQHKPQNGRSTKPLVAYLKLKHAVQTHATPNEKTTSTRYGPVVCQFSSIGNFSEKWLREFSTSLSVTSPQKGKPDLVDLVKVVWPTYHEIEGSHVGLPGGAALPGRSKNLRKKFLTPLLCKWRPREQQSNRNPIHRPRSIPHIKTFFQLAHTKQQDVTEKSFAWFCIGSQNLSIAAWGQVINGKYGKCHKVNAWEMAVFVCPSLMVGKERLVPFAGKERSKDMDSATIFSQRYPMECG